MNRIRTIIISSLITLILTSVVFALIFSPNRDTNDKGSLSSILNDTSGRSVYNASQKFNADDQISEGRQTVITKTVKEVSPAVVGITVTEIRQYRDIFSLDPFFRQFYGDRVYSQAVKGLGSGAIISSDGYVLTNDHVAGNAVEAIVTLTDGRQYNAKIIGSDQVSDVCLLKIDAANLPYIKFGRSDDLMIGEWAIALGNPFGLFNINDKPTVTVGVISATGMNLGTRDNRSYVDMIQTDASINSGNSGGPLVNALGELIGMNTLIFTPNGSSGGSVGVGFAIPVNKIKKVVEELKKNGKVDRNFWTGLSVQALNESIAKAYNLKSTNGVIITQVQKNSPAYKAGLQMYDIILSIDKIKVNDDATLIGVLQEYRPGDTINVNILRDDKNLTLKMKLERK